MNDVDHHLSQFSEPEQAALNRIRNIVKQTVPEAVESISYGMPAFKYKGKPLFYYNAFKDHLSVFPSGPTEVLGKQLAGFKTSKGTVQFTLDKQLPEDVIVSMLRLRLEAIG